MSSISVTPSRAGATAAGSRRIGLYTDSDIVGGAERSLLHLAGAYTGPHELIICAPAAPVLDAAAELAPHVRTELTTSRSSGPRALLEQRRALARLDLDLLQITLGNPFRCRLTMAAAWTLRLPVVAVEQLVLPAARRRGALLKRLWSRPLAGHIAVGGESAAELHRAFGIPRARIDVVHNGVPDVAVVPRRVSERRVVGTAARLEDQKAVNVLLDAVALLGDRAIDVVIVGDGERRAELERHASDLGLGDRVHFVGWVADARPFIAGFDVFALPSRDEAFPLSIVEAMLAGVPVVASDVGSVSEAIIDGRTGLLTPPGDAASLAATLARLLDSRQLRDQLAAAAGMLARQEFTADAMAAKYALVWERTLR